MAKSTKSKKELDGSKLKLPPKKTVVKPPDVLPDVETEKIINNIHPASEAPAPVGPASRASVLIPGDIYPILKKHVSIDNRSTFQEYFMNLCKKDLKEKGLLD